MNLEGPHTRSGVYGGSEIAARGAPFFDPPPPVFGWHHLVSHCHAMMVAMEFIGHFSPWLAEPRPCWHCVHFGGMLFGGSAAGCTAPGSAKVRAMPKDGCSQWEREPGADDEPGPPGDTPHSGDCSTSAS